MMIEVDRLERTFGEKRAVAGLTFQVPEAAVYGFLGPNGAGKSTTMKILSTLLAPTAGTARVAGHDVTRAPDQVRRLLGMVFQDPAVDDRLTARENLLLHCMIYGVPRRERARRIDEALSWIDLAAEAGTRVRSFSGGMRRRLEVARALLHRPRVLLLDEPTTGLDPQTRRALWERLHALRRDEGLTLFVTTHYMDEAEVCDRVAIIDHGVLVAEDAPAALRARVGVQRVTLSTADDAAAADQLTRLGLEPQRTPGGVEFAVDGVEGFLPRLAGFPVPIRGLQVRQPTLEDAFVALTGRNIRPEAASDRDKLRGAARRRGRLR
jgi:ABC-2 type transport system ATP-binding protein